MTATDAYKPPCRSHLRVIKAGSDARMIQTGTDMTHGKDMTMRTLSIIALVAATSIGTAGFAQVDIKDRIERGTYKALDIQDREDRVFGALDLGDRDNRLIGSRDLGDRQTDIRIG